MILNKAENYDSNKVLECFDPLAVLHLKKLYSLSNSTDATSEEAAHQHDCDSSESS